jgi:hypothetical protein
MQINISDNKAGIWLSKVVKAFGLGTNAFTNVTFPFSLGN